MTRHNIGIKLQFVFSTWDWNVDVQITTKVNEIYQDVSYNENNVVNQTLKAKAEAYFEKVPRDTTLTDKMQYNLLNEFV